MIWHSINEIEPNYRGFLFALIDILFTMGDTKLIWLVCQKKKRTQK